MGARTVDMTDFDPRQLPWDLGRAAVAAALWDLYEAAEREARFADGARLRVMLRTVNRCDQEHFAHMVQLATKGI